MPLLSNEKWKQNVDRAIRYNIPHLSCYALTVEPKTPLHKMIASHKTDDINPDKQSEQFLLLMQWLEDAGYEHYEISNFAKPGSRSRHNSSYWQGKKYRGIGPSSHSFNGSSRQWNISNNQQYIESINNDVIPFEIEFLSPTQQLNEYIMTSLRTIEGISFEKITGVNQSKILTTAEKYIRTGKMVMLNNSLLLTKEGKLLADGIAAELFF
jgi:oxygen-independent coproporphyrinogen-3 oxidase